jgi:hypothetical protein
MLCLKQQDGTVTLPYNPNISIILYTACPIPTLRETVLNRRSRIFLKLENLQPSGSFKSR